LCQRGAIVRLDPSFVHPCPVPKLLGNIERVDVGGLPPGLFIADAMHLAMVHPAERHRELVACLAPERPWLCVAQVVWVGWLAAADEARLPSNIAQMVFVAIAARLSDRERSLT